MKAKRCRILYVQKASAGGAVISLYELVRGLDTNIYEPIVLFYRPSFYLGEYKAVGVKVITLSGASPPSEPTKPRREIGALLNRCNRWLGSTYQSVRSDFLTARLDWQFAVRLARIMKQEAINLVHHSNSLYANRDAVIAASLVGMPQVCHVRQFERLSFLEKYLAHHVDAFIYNSKAVERHYRNQGIPAQQGKVVYNPINVEAFARTHSSVDLRGALGLTDRDWVVSNVGRIACWKGQDYFLKAMAEVMRSHPNTKALIVGQVDPGPINQNYYEKLRQLVADMNMSGRVQFTGFRSDIPEIMAASDLIVHSASEPEPFGRVVVEAMAAGKPVIATAAGGVLEIIEDQVNALLVPPGNPGALAMAIQRVLENRELSRQIAMRSQQDVRDRFSIARHVKAVEQIYQSVLAA